MVELNFTSILTIVQIMMPEKTDTSQIYPLVGPILPVLDRKSWGRGKGNSPIVPAGNGYLLRNCAGDVHIERKNEMRIAKENYEKHV